MPVEVIISDDQSTAFFEGTGRGELLLRHCLDCGHWCAPETQACTACHSANLKWLASSGLGRIATFGIVHARGNPPGRIAVAVVEVNEGPWIQTQIVAAAPGTLQIGDRVQVGFEQPKGGEALPVFRPTAG